MEPLQWNIRSSLSKHERSELKAPLFKALWDFVPAKDDPESHGALLDHYFNQLDLVEAYNLNLRTHENVVQLIGFVKDNITSTREILQKELTTHHGAILGPAPDSAEKAIGLAVQLWLMLGPDKWDSNKTLKEFIHENFPRNDRPTSGSMFPTTINAYTLERVGGFEIVWTENIQDHLLLFANHGQTELRIFHLTSFLRIHKCSQDNQIYPSDLLSETERTIALIFPPTNINCRRWIRKARKEDRIDLEANIIPGETRDLKSYHYWELRLLAIIEEYDRTEPTSLRQWAVDKRRPNQRYTFWIAVIALALALVFGLIQSVTGIIQVIMAEKGS
ncbi:hypothetical protein BDW68DRAFT_167546 [Aspergillus falconensis]